MNKQLLINFFKLRVTVGALGETQTPHWWTTSFLNDTSSAFLSHIFSKTYRFAQYQGVREAACRVHDDHIGFGKVYHLFRLPEEIEFDLQNLLISQPNSLEDIFTGLGDSQLPLAELSRLAGEKKVMATGPVSIGRINDLSKSGSIENMAQYYLGAFSGSGKVYPYFAE